VGAGVSRPAPVFFSRAVQELLDQVDPRMISLYAHMWAGGDGFPRRGGA